MDLLQTGRLSGILPQIPLLFTEVVIGIFALVSVIRFTKNLPGAAR